MPEYSSRYSNKRKNPRKNIFRKCNKSNKNWPKKSSMPNTSAITICLMCLSKKMNRTKTKLSWTDQQVYLKSIKWETSSWSKPMKILPTSKAAACRRYLKKNKSLLNTKTIWGRWRLAANCLLKNRVDIFSK